MHGMMRLWRLPGACWGTVKARSPGLCLGPWGERSDTPRTLILLQTPSQAGGQLSGAVSQRQRVQHEGDQAGGGRRSPGRGSLTSCPRHCPCTGRAAETVNYSGPRTLIMVSGGGAGQRGRQGCFVQTLDSLNHQRSLLCQPALGVRLGGPLAGRILCSVGRLFGERGAGDTANICMGFWRDAERGNKDAGGRRICGLGRSLSGGSVPR